MVTSSAGREARALRHRQRRVAAERRERVADERDDRVVVDVARGGHEHRRRRVARRAPRQQVLARDPRDGVREADRRVAEVRAAPQRAREAVVHHLARRVVVHLDLFEHDLLLAREVVRGEARVLQHVGQHVDGQRQMPVDDVGVEARRLLVGHRVELAADRVHLLGDPARRPPLRALEDHVLEQVRDAAVRGRLVRRPDVRPHADGGGAHVGHRLGQHEQTVRKRGGADHPVVPFDSDARKAGSQNTPAPLGKRARTRARAARGTVIEKTVAAVGLA